MIPDSTGISVYLTAFDETVAVNKYLICKYVFAESKYFVVAIGDADSSFDVTLLSDTELFVSGIQESTGRLVIMRIGKISFIIYADYPLVCSRVFSSLLKGDYDESLVSFTLCLVVFH